MKKKIQYKVIDYVNLEHHDNITVQERLNELGAHGFNLSQVIDMCENNTNKEGKTSRFRYILTKQYE